VNARTARLYSRRSRRLFPRYELAAMLPLFAASKADPINKDGSGIASNGYDQVAYFTEGKAVKEAPMFTYSWMSRRGGSRVPMSAT
jgi:hypothetical protein